jgi:tetratricopeptide (TPR) repeat protein
MKVVAFRKPSVASMVHKLRRTVDNDDRVGFEEVVVEMKAKRDEHDSLTQQRLKRLGYGMIYQESFEWAIAIFKVGVDLFPESANSYDCLAEAYLKSGDKKNAIYFYEQALKVDPNFRNSQKMLKELGRSE